MKEDLKAVAAITCKPLSMDQLTAIENWVLKKINGIPVRYRLLIPRDGSFCETELSHSELISVVKAESQVHKLHDFFFPTVLSPEWRSVVDHLCKKMVTIQRCSDSEFPCTIKEALREMLDVCHNLSVDFSQGIQKEAFDYAQRNASSVDYWFDAQPMFRRVAEQMRNSGETVPLSTDFFKGLKELGVQFRKSTPSSFVSPRRRMAYVSSRTFATICKAAEENLSWQ